MNHYGSYILGASKNLLYRSGELLTQLGALEDLIDQPTAQPIDWTELKRQERANNLRIYWEKKHQRKELMRSLAKLYPKGTSTQTDIKDTQVISELTSVFSPHGQQRRDFNEQLQDIVPTARIPWRHIIIRQVKDGTDTFTESSPRCGQVRPCFGPGREFAARRRCCQKWIWERGWVSGIPCLPVPSRAPHRYPYHKCSGRPA